MKKNLIFSQYLIIQKNKEKELNILEQKINQRENYFNIEKEKEMKNIAAEKKYWLEKKNLEKLRKKYEEDQKVKIKFEDIKNKYEDELKKGKEKYKEIEKKY